MEDNETKPILMDANGRNPDGTVKKGYVLNPKGRPPKRQIEDYITEEDVINIVATAKKEAMTGKPQLLETLLGYMFGKPLQRIGNSDGSNLFDPISKEQSDEAIKNYLDEHSRDISRTEQEPEKSVIPIQQD